MTTEKDLQEVIEKEDAHHRLACAIERRPYDPPAERKRLSVLAEAVRRGEVAEGRDPLPEDAQRRIQEILAGGPPIPQDVYERLARAVQG